MIIKNSGLIKVQIISFVFIFTENFISFSQRNIKDFPNTKETISEKAFTNRNILSYIFFIYVSKIYFFFQLLTEKKKCRPIMADTKSIAKVYQSCTIFFLLPKPNGSSTSTQNSLIIFLAKFFIPHGINSSQGCGKPEGSVKPLIFQE